MDFMRDIFNKSIPRFGYVIEKDNGIDIVVILGVSNVEKIGKYPFEDRIYQINKKMQSIYNQKELSDNDKIQLVELLEEMNKFCEPQDYKVLATGYEQEAFVNRLTANESKQLDEQLQMLNVCRNLYPKFSNRFKR
ncbi:MAG: hypothetical protein IJF49_09165 [Clostridia bacterium]|nr:hypothetical protein [Clostridia bacterium]